jgi:ribosomal protein S18 acetylase RimI-like enzyme
MRLVRLEDRHGAALLRFFRDLPDADRTFIKEDVTDPDTVRAWTSAEARSSRWVALDDEHAGSGSADGGSADGDSADGGSADGDPGDAPVVGYVAVLPLAGWSDHVGEIRLVVAPSRRGSGLGRELARHALGQGVEAGLTKLIVEVVADQGPALALFTALGFTGEALLRDQIRDREGSLRDLMVLAHHVDDTWSGMDTVGMPDALDEQPG